MQFHITWFHIIILVSSNLILNSCSLHLGYCSVQDMASQTNGLDTFSAVMSMHIIKVASDSQSLLMLFTPAAALAHISQTWCPAMWIWSYFFCKNELRDIAKSLWTHKRVSHNQVTISCDWNSHWKRLWVYSPLLFTYASSPFPASIIQLAVVAQFSTLKCLQSIFQTTWMFTPLVRTFPFSILKIMIEPFNSLCRLQLHVD